MPLVHGADADKILRPILTDADGKVYVIMGNGLTVEANDGDPTYTNTDTIKIEELDGFRLSSPAAGQVLVETVGLPWLLLSDTSYLSISNDNTNRDLAAATFNVSNMLGGYDKVRFNIYGYILNNSGAARVFTFRSYYDGTLLATSALSIPASATPIGFSVDGIIGFHINRGDLVSVMNAQAGAAFVFSRGSADGLATSGNRIFKVMVQMATASASEFWVRYLHEWYFVNNHSNVG